MDRSVTLGESVPVLLINFGVRDGRTYRGVACDSYSIDSVMYYHSRE